MIRYLFFLLLISSAPLYSHEIKPAIVDITILEGKASIEFKLNAETILSEIDASAYEDTNNSPQFQKYDELRSLSASEIEKLVLEDKFNFLNKIKIISVDEDVGLVLNKVTKAKSDFEQINHFDEIFSFLSHEINNPISSIKLASDLIKKRYTNVDDELLEIIKSEALRITRLFHNFTLTEASNISIKKKENIHELIRLCLFKIKQMPNKLHIYEEFDPSLPLININRDLIMQALDNILINAYESSLFSKSSYLKIKTRFVIGESISIPNIKKSIKKSSLKISICDNGNGIPKEFIDKIFLPFYSTKKRGSGIGLFLVKRIIDDHEGTIALESQEGVTTAQIILPF